MIKKYKELELVDSEYDLSLRCSEVDGFLRKMCKKAHYFSGGMNCTTNIHIVLLINKTF